VHGMAFGEPESLDGNRSLYAVGVHASIVESDAAAEGMANEARGEIIDDVKQGGEIEDVLGDSVRRSGGPSAVAVPAEIEGVDVVLPAQRVRDPIPIARVIERAVNEDERRFAVRAVVPELELEAVGVEKV
jgi:hypothetical protein